MKISGNYQLATSKDLAWKVLNDTEHLQRCIPGCEAFEQVSENCFDAMIRAKFGPIDTKFKTKIKLEDIKPPESYSLVVEGKGGSVGMGKGVARIDLQENSAGTQLNYVVDFNVKGKLAQIGSRLVLNAIQKLTNDFFAKFETYFMDDEQVQLAEATAREASNARVKSRNTRILVVIGILIMGAVLYWRTAAA